MQGSLLRQFALWLFRYPPYTPYVTINVDVDFTPARRYLDALNASPGDKPRVTVQHLLVAMFGRLYNEFPNANAHVVGRRIMRHRGVNIALPVDMLGTDAGKDIEVSFLVVDHAERLALRAIAGRMRRSVSAERSGKPQFPLAKLLIPIAKRTPAWLFEALLDGLDTLAKSWPLGPITHRLFPISLAITNPGAVFGNVPGGRFISGSMSPPNRIVSIGTVVGVSAIQDQVLAVDGAPAVRPTLPLIFIFDHRLFDGVMASRILSRLAEMMRDPAAVLGDDGEREG